MLYVPIPKGLRLNKMFLPSVYRILRSAGNVYPTTKHSPSKTIGSTKPWTCSLQPTFYITTFTKPIHHKLMCIIILRMLVLTLLLFGSFLSVLPVYGQINARLWTYRPITTGFLRSTGRIICPIPKIHNPVYLIFLLTKNELHLHVLKQISASATGNIWQKPLKNYQVFVTR